MNNKEYNTCWLNTNPNFGIELLKQQYEVFSKLRKRFMWENRGLEFRELNNELKQLMTIINAKENGTSF